MDEGLNRKIGSDRDGTVAEDVLQLRYPVEAWIERLLQKYPQELASIRPKQVKERAVRLHAVHRQLKAHVVKARS